MLEQEDSILQNDPNQYGAGETSQSVEQALDWPESDLKHSSLQTPIRTHLSNVVQAGQLQSRMKIFQYDVIRTLGRRVQR